MCRNYISVMLILSVALANNALLTVSANPVSEPSFECTQSSHCDAGECCVIGMQRYSLPSCLKLGKEGDSCRPQNEPINRTLSYPNGVILQLSDSYTLLCPCDTSSGLTCTYGQCQKSISEDITNHV